MDHLVGDDQPRPGAVIPDPPGRRIPFNCGREEILKFANRPGAVRSTPQIGPPLSADSKKAPHENVKLSKRSMKGAYDDEATLKGRKFIREKY
jgi:hypothetical protein